MMSAYVSALCWVVTILLRAMSILAVQSPPYAFYAPITARPCSVIKRYHRGDFQKSLLEETLRGGIEDSSFVTIERVSSRERALDVRVFRGWSVTAEEYIQQQCQNENKESPRWSGITYFEAVKELTKSYNDEGVDTTILGDEPLVTYVAIYHHGDDENTMRQTTREVRDSLAFMHRTNGVVGTVDSQVKNHGVYSSMATPESIQQFISKSNLPWPHLYTKNLHVDSRMRRRGIALALVRANSAYARERGMKNMILTVDPTNETGAIQLYEREGFRFMGDTDEGIMICNDDSSARV